jgi:hypothetical protein
MSLTDEILGLLEESDALTEEFNSLDERLKKLEQSGGAPEQFDAIFQALERDIEEDSIESLLRAEECLSSIIKLRIQQILDVKG